MTTTRAERSDRTTGVRIRGALAGHPAAAAFAREVRRIHGRYADEVVAAFELCPFLRDAESGFGQFCVMLEREPSVEESARATLEAGPGVVHLVYPLVTVGATAFERFGAALAAEVKRALGANREPPVMAVFHPRLSGDSSSPHRLVGLLRRAPDPFVQFVPVGLHEGGTVFAGGLEDRDPAQWLAIESQDPAEKNHRRLAGGDLARVLALLEDVREDRQASYAAHLAELGAV